MAARPPTAVKRIQRVKEEKEGGGGGGRRGENWQQARERQEIQLDLGHCMPDIQSRPGALLFAVSVSSRLPKITGGTVNPVVCHSTPTAV